MKKIAVIALLAFALFASQEAFYEDDITPKEAFEMQKKGAVIIDVRSAAEYLYAGHPKGAVNIPIFEFNYSPKNIDIRIKASKMEQRGKKADLHKLYDITPIENGKFLEDVKKLYSKLKPKEIVVICRSGARSEYAANILAKNGFKNVYNVEDGYIFGWKRDNLPSVTE